MKYRISKNTLILDEDMRRTRTHRHAFKSTLIRYQVRCGAVSQATMGACAFLRATSSIVNAIQGFDSFALTLSLSSDC